MTQPEHIMAQVADLARSVCGRKVLGGRFGLNSLIFFHPDLEAEPLRELYEKLCADIASRLGVRAGVGLACWPFLDLRPSDMIEGARQGARIRALAPRAAHRAVRFPRPEHQRGQAALPGRRVRGHRRV